MTSITATYTLSSIEASAGHSAVTLGVDIEQDPVYLSATVRPSHSFARLMLALGQVVRMRATRQRRDYSEYQQWVRGEYLKELPAVTAAAAERLQTLLPEREALAAQLAELTRSVAALQPRSHVWRRQRKEFWRWLYEHHREAWIVLDPIVSVQPDATFFESFSIDQSMYARVRVPDEAFERDRPVRLGTTNIDFSVALERELARTRSYRSLHLTVGSESVQMRSSESVVVERKIDLPDSWVRGLVEVQSALALTPVELTLSAGAVADVIARVQSEREKQGPRALVFELTPGEHVRIRVEPWNDTITDTRSTYSGDAPRKIKVWGRRRLDVLMDLLPHVDRVTVQLGDSGMPSFWNIELDGLVFTLGLTGWSAMDWSGRARFSAMIPSAAVDSALIDGAAKLLRETMSLSTDELMVAVNVPPQEARALLQRLCLAGQAMYDPLGRRYRWRALYPKLDLSVGADAGREERKGIDLANSHAATVDSDQIVGNARRISATVSAGDRVNKVIIEADADGRVSYAQCDCSHFRHHKMRQGPCRHIVATTLAEDVP